MNHRHHTGRAGSQIPAILNIILEKQKRAKEEKKANLPVLNDLHEDTIPFHLYSSITMEPVCIYDRKYSFQTWYFRMEEIISFNKVKLSLLKPFDEIGNPVDSILETYRLEKTGIMITVSLDDFCAIQCLSPKLVNRKVLIIEPKC